ncbi:unnamed protein product [Paramecium primaurelia]|uniref:Mitochondrial import inner membrane translocase subunit TIM50 n=1 Tax=Paramecium primaurelia TaxID=5886 RepID=A0A8S1JNF9_PARPR|nr:unnamed protein product [Paramecium primaurelia]
MIQSKQIRVYLTNLIKDHNNYFLFLRIQNMNNSLNYQIFPQITIIKQDDTELNDIQANIYSEFLAIILCYIMKHDLTVSMFYSYKFKFIKTITIHHQMWMKFIQHNEDLFQKLQQIQFSLDQFTSIIIQSHIDNIHLRNQLLDYLKFKQNQNNFPIYSKIIINKILTLLLTPNLIYYHLPINFESYTLVLDMDETIIYYDGDKVHQRPFLLTFLKQMSRIYELILFTAGLESYANRILNQLTIKKYFSYLLFRQHTNIYQDFYGKDLRKLGRLLSKTIIIDNTPECFSLQPENGIQIQTWKGEQSDTLLLILIPILKTIRFSNKDIRMKLREYKNYSGLIFPK